MLIRMVASFVLMFAVVAPVAQGQTFKVDPVHSTVIFEVSHLGIVPFYGRINEPGGQIVLDQQDPSKSTFLVTLDANKIDTANAKRDEHLRSPDYFNAKQFPQMTFKSNSVSKTGENSYEVTGELTMHGVTRPVTVTLTGGKIVENPQFGTRTGFGGSFKVNRQDFGITAASGLLGDEVTIMLGIEGIQE